MPRFRVLAVNCGASHVACGVFAFGRDGSLILLRHALSSHPPDAPEAEWLARTEAALRGLAREHGFRGPCVLTPPGHQVLTRFIRLPALAPKPLAKVIRFEAAQQIPYPLAEVAWSLAPAGESGGERLLSAMKLDFMNALCAAAQRAGLMPERATPPCLALRDALRHAHPERPEPALLLALDTRATHLVFADPKRFFARTLAFGSNTPPQAFAESPQNPPPNDDALPGEGSAARHAALDSLVGRLQPEITRSTVQWRSQGGTVPTRIYVTGDAALSAELRALLQEKLSLPVEPLDALRHVSLVGAGPAIDSLFPAELVGLAAGEMAAKRTDPGLLPARFRLAASFRRRQPWLLAAAALLAVALAPPLVHFHRRAATANARIALIESALRPLREPLHRNETNLAQIADLRRRRAEIESLVRARTAWRDFLADLQAHLAAVEDTWLDRLQMQAPAAPGAGSGDSTTPIGAPPALRLALSGRLLDRRHPLAKVSVVPQRRAQALLARFASSDFITAVEQEQFDSGQPGLLRFHCVLTLNAENLPSS